MNNGEVMSRIYLELYNVIAPKVGDEPPSDMFHLMTVGRTVEDGMDVRSLTNIIPAVNKSYATTGKMASGAYFTSLSGHFKTDHKHTPQEEENHLKCLNILYDNYGTEDEEESRKYLKFKKARKKWELARRTMEAAKNNPNYPVRGNDDHPSIAELEYDVEETYDDLKMAYRDEVEHALTEINTYNSFSPSSFIERLKERYLAASKDNFPVTCDPPNWSSEPFWRRMAWKKVDIKTSSSSSHIHTDIQKVDDSFESSYKRGFWFFTSGGNQESMNYSLSKDLETVTSTDKLAISLELAEVAVNRDWLDTSFFSFSDVYIDGQKQGYITKGSLSAAGAAGCQMPLIPTSLILAKDVKIYDDFNENVYKFIENTHGSSDTRSHYGPFGSGSAKVKHSDSSTYSDEERKNYPQTSKIEFPGVQLIGIKCAVTAPVFPPIDAPH